MNDVSGHGNNFTGTTTSGPTVLSGSAGINGRTAVHFGGSSTATNQLVLNNSTSPDTVLIIDRVTATTGLGGIWGQVGDWGIRESGSTWQAGGGGNNGDYPNPSYGGSLYINAAQVASNANGAFTVGTAQLLEATNTNGAQNGVWTQTGLGEYGTGGRTTASSPATSARSWPTAAS